jgi:hypothetical protein
MRAGGAGVARGGCHTHAGYKATAKDGASTAKAVASATKSRATANGSGSGSDAEAECTLSASIVTAVATGGSTAIGSDPSAPTCNKVGGGIAKATSPMGDCH